ncbi:MAG: TetR/AcrR family transcriptional regulator [Ancalomicrobiaceae bacterium]|nr:TetR/AcrR family transcriptional regulator [Ancalomicrobiaceae bacterium]
MEEPGTKSSPRDRIVDTATALFRKHGIRGIGVDAIVEAAGTNKMTLYRHFGSKDELVAECIRGQAAHADEKWAKLACEYPNDPVGQLGGWIKMVANYICTEVHGCDLVNTAIELHEDEHPARAVIAEFKTVHLRKLAEVCRAAGAADPELLANTLYMLMEGARVSRQINGADGPSARFMRVAEAAVAASIAAGVAGAAEVG